MKDYQSEEWAHMIAHAQKTLTSPCPLIEDEVLVAVDDELKQLRDEKEALQAKIDALMIEFCHDEMTSDQLKNWEKCLKMSNNSDLELLEDNKALRDYVASLINTLPKLKADAVREAAQLVMYEYEGEARNRDIAEYLEDYADKIERGE